MFHPKDILKRMIIMMTFEQKNDLQVNHCWWTSVFRMRMRLAHKVTLEVLELCQALLPHGSPMKSSHQKSIGLKKKHSIERDIYIYIHIFHGAFHGMYYGISWMHYGCIMDVHSLIPLQNATAWYATHPLVVQKSGSPRPEICSILDLESPFFTVSVSVG